MNKDVKKAYSSHEDGFMYEVGKIVNPDSYNDDIRLDCTNGIHFFVTKQEAEEW